MRLRNLFMPMLVGLAFVGCSNEDVVNPDNGNDTNGETKYLNVSINSVGSITRATTPPGDYEKGTGNENKVAKVRFYFFDEDGKAAPVKKNDENIWVNYYDYENPQEKGDDMNNVEKILDAIVVIQTPDDKKPSSIVAVLNPTSEIKTKKENGSLLDLEDLNGIISDFSETATATDGFLMSNSVYADGTTKMEAVSVAGHLYPNPTEAKKNPVRIHVERVLAKTRLTVGLSAESNGSYKTSTDGSQTYDGEEIFVKFLGWNVTATAKTSRLMKEINPAWSAELFSATILWNTKDYYRSFWAVNPTSMGYTYGPFNTADDATAANALTSFVDNETTLNYTYLQENASDNKETGANPTKPSQVIIAAQLVDKNGSPMEFAEYAGERTTVEDLLIKYASVAGLWTDNGEKTGKREIEASDIELKTATQAEMADEETAGRYKVYAQLTTTAAAKIWYASKANDASAVEDPNGMLEALGGAKVWKDGYTYYYFDIRHLNGDATDKDAKGKYGVVRNHVYAAKINSLAGLGTPVYDPDEVIYPEKPTDDESIIAAEIRILSWRIVNQNIDLEW